MKKTLLMLVASAVAFAASADLTTFGWSAGGNNQVTAGEKVNTVVGFDITSLVSGGEIDIDDLNSISIYSTLDAIAIPVFLGGGWQTANMIDDGSIAGDFAYAIIGDLGSVAVNDVLTFIGASGPITELQADPELPASLPQAITPGSYSSVTVVPEPATIGLFGLGALSAWIIRRNKAKATEEA